MRMRCARRVFCGGARVPAARRVERASQRRLSDVAARVAAEEYARANEVLRGALWPQPASQQALQRVSVSLLHMLAADLGAAFGAMVAVLPVGGALNKGSVGSWAPRRGSRIPIMTKTAP